MVNIAMIEASKGRILDEFYESNVRPFGRRVRRFIEEQLVTPSGFRTARTRDEALKAGLTASTLESLVRGRLLRVEDRYGVAHVELTHDVLTRVVSANRRRRRDRRASRMAAIFGGTAVFLLLAVLAGGTWYWASHLRHHEVLCSEFVMQFGVPAANTL